MPFGPGAGVDIGARLLADRLTVRWGKPVVIENRPGADGLVAIQAFLAANDDHTLLASPSGSFTVHPFQYEKLPYTPADLVPLARISNTILAVGVPESMKIGTLAEFVTRARAEAGKFNAAVVPGITEFTFDYFVKTVGLSVQKVPTGTSFKPRPTWVKAGSRSTWRRTRSCSRRRRPAASRHWQ